jgi:peptidoglycan/LPS O-acetylase OafA/YrhL
MVPLVLLLPVFGSDWDRLLTVAFPVVIPLAARIRLRWWILALFLAVQASLAALTIERVSTIYTDYNNSLPTGHFENRNPALTAALLGTGVLLALFGAARSTPLRATITRPTRA